MDQLLQANLQVITLLGAVFEEVERRGRPAGRRRAGLRTWAGQPSQPAVPVTQNHHAN